MLVEPVGVEMVAVMAGGKWLGVGWDWGGYPSQKYSRAILTRHPCFAKNHSTNFGIPSAIWVCGLYPNNARDLVMSA
jgi:hypothetical protein